MNDTRELNRSGRALFEQEVEYISEPSRRTLERFDQPLSVGQQKYVDEKKGTDSYGASGHVARMTRQFKQSKSRAQTAMQVAIVDLFEVLMNNYGYKFLQNYSDVGNTLQFWLDQVKEITVFRESLQVVHIQVLVQYIKSGHYYPDWPPTAPGALMHVLCDAARSAMGWLPTQQAFSDLRKNKRRAHDKQWLKYQNVGVYYAGEGMSSVDLESNDFYLLRELNEQFSSQYDKATFIQATYRDLLERLSVREKKSNAGQTSTSIGTSRDSFRGDPARDEAQPFTTDSRDEIMAKMRGLLDSVSLRK